MSGETESRPTAWTVDSLKEHLEVVVAALKELTEQRFDAQDAAVDAAMAASSAATGKAEANAEKWRDSANEWRGAMSDREREFLRQDTYDRAHTDLIERVEMMNRTLTEKHDAAVAALYDKIETLASRVSEIAAVTG